MTGPQLPVGTGRWSRRIARALGSRLGSGGVAFRQPQAQEVEVKSGFSGIWRRSVLLRLGGWDEAWSVNEDLELAARIRQAGGRIVCVPELAARYVPRDSLRALARQYWRYGWYRVKTARRHPDVLRRSQLLAPALALTVVAGALSPLRKPARAALALYTAAVLVESARVGTKGSARDGIALPLVFATMHLSWGFGFLTGCLRHGPPAAALAQRFRE